MKRYKSSLYDNISAIAEHKDNIRQIQIISYAPDGSATNYIEPEKYNDYINFLQSVKVSSCNNTNLCGTSKRLTIRFDNNTEFSALFMRYYISFGSRYYKIENYKDINNIL